KVDRSEVIRADGRLERPGADVLSAPRPAVAGTEDPDPSVTGGDDVAGIPNAGNPAPLTAGGVDPEEVAANGHPDPTIRPRDSVVGLLRRVSLRDLTC